MKFSKTDPIFFLIAFFISAFVFLNAGVRTSADSKEAYVEALLKKMTLKEKVGQMNQITLEVVSKPRKEGSAINQLDLKKLREAIVDHGIGSILNTGGAANTAENWQEMIRTMQTMALKKTRLGIPILYGIDAIHGANYISEATLFPQSIAMAATFNKDLVREEGRITALETRAAGIPWNFNPVLGLGRQPLWPRMWETYGEDSYLCSVLGREYILGLQGEDRDVSKPDRVAACMKHYAGYSVPLSGHDRTPAWIPERLMRELFLPPFHEAVKAGVLTVMVNSGEVNGIPTHANAFLLKKVLRDEWGFKGLVVSDWADVINLYQRDHVARSPKEAVRIAVEAGLDMSMVPFDFSFARYLIELVNEGTIPESRIDQSVRRILRLKAALGLFADPYPHKERLKLIGSITHKKVSLKAAQEAVTLLKNQDGLLPLKKTMRILVTGPAADYKPALNGGWSYTWQGNETQYYPSSDLTVVQALRQKIGAQNVVYVQGANFKRLTNLNKARQAAQKADAIVVCVGEDSYCETPGNINDLTMSHAQLQLVKAMTQSGKPVVMVLLEGRPRVVNSVVDEVNAVLMAYLPGPQGAEAIADILFGDVNPSGRLPFSYPRYVNDLICYDHKYNENYDLNRYNPQWSFGYGLSYSTFKYNQLELSKNQIRADETLTVSVNITNTGKTAGKEAVLLYLSDLVRSVTPPVKRLKRFTKITLKPGESQTIRFVLGPEDFAFVNAQNKRVIEPGVFKVQVGGLEKTLRIGD